jgi:putative endonuclease
MRFRNISPTPGRTQRAAVPRSLPTVQTRHEGPDDDHCDAQLNAHLSSFRTTASYARSEDTHNTRCAALRDVKAFMARERVYCVYILANKANGTLFIGITDNLIQCIQEHHDGLVPGFSKRYAVKLLVYFEMHDDINGAILREKRMKRWRRQWKIELIEKYNPQWRDLWLELIAEDERA